jgi:hypothetical protein
MVYQSPTHGILTSFPWYIKPITHGILNPYTWYIEPHTHGISKPPTNEILNTLPIVYGTPYPWYIEPPTNGILNPLATLVVIGTDCTDSCK